MVKQYPHTMILTAVSGNVQDGNGNFSSGTQDIVQQVCRCELSGGNAMIPGPSGTKVNFSAILYMPLPVDDIAVGTEVEVQDENLNTILKDKVLQFNRGQLNARVWL